MGIRALRPDEIECRIQSTGKTKEGKAWAIVLLYKDARCDMNILDEVYGITGWQRSHELIDGKMFCTISIWDEIKEQWIKKQDVGTESNTEQVKGQVSDSYKRACFNLGIGRELYTAPFIFIYLNDNEYYLKDDKVKATTKAKFKVEKISTESGKIKKIRIVDNNNIERYLLT